MKDLYSHFAGSGKDAGAQAPLVPNCPDVLSHVRATVRLASALGIDAEERLVFPAPLLSRLCGRRMFFLRGWKRYAGCVKGFNALGLLAEHAAIEERALGALPVAGLRRAKREFLASKIGAAGLTDAQVDRVDSLFVALWRAYARRTIVCATSSNLGICLHQALRDMRRKELSVAGKKFKLLGKDEGRLIIWCPDERADFMSPEKSALLRRLEAEEPRLTTLRPYLNRPQRDIGALKDALACGGYFFPTNPQSRAELQSLLAAAARDIGAMDGAKVRRALKSLGAELSGGRVRARSAVEGGMFGMAAPYLRMIEEARRRGGVRAAPDLGHRKGLPGPLPRTRAVCVWNPVSIGAALAAMALGDKALRGAGLQTRIHGVFDIANLQSLAQLFGVVVRRHQSGRQTAYVGLGSSSYANGNLCFDILREKGAFRGRGHLHPATHALNPVARALVYAEGFPKPEPAGAAALAGYLLARLDGGTLSVAELAFALRRGGFSKASFLGFSGMDAERFTLQAAEEGVFMGSLAKSLLAALEWEPARLRRAAEAERAKSRRAYRAKGLDDAGFEARDPDVHINLTGDYCVQPPRGRYSRDRYLAGASRARRRWGRR